jgi:hypothetical protein
MCNGIINNINKEIPPAILKPKKLHRDFEPFAKNNNVDKTLPHKLTIHFKSE